MRILLPFLSAVFCLRLLLANLFPLTADESYYWLWSRHLDWSYVDHPPMVALVNYLLTQGHANLFMLRLGTVIISTLVSILIYYIAKEAFNEKVAFWSMVLFNILPHFAIIWLTMFIELPLTLFWALSLFLLLKIEKTKEKQWWYLLGATVGLGLLSKYTMILFWPCLGLFFLLSKEDRFWLKQKEPYLAGLISALFLTPIIYWNSRHEWVSFTFHATRGSSPFGENFLPFVGDQLVHFTPFFVIVLLSAFASLLRHARENGHPDLDSRLRGNDTLLFSFSFPILILFLLLSFKTKVWAHWPSVGYIAAIPLAVDYLGEKRTRFFKWVGGFTIILLIILFFVAPGILLHQKEYAENYQLGNKLPADLKIFAQTNVSASLLEFYTGRQTYYNGPAWGEKQYQIWGIPALAPGESIIYFGREALTPLPALKLQLIEDYIREDYHFFLLKNQKRTGGKP